ncbi:Gfo/Idh/MocA family protein [Mycolicibacterium holsaticum]|uniref:Oxidoreductase n=1 Tax=Mycolicibacterium holsaticum TaxID=152142 RepID=A0A1E3S1H5_9MYCO|nr:Gfo/Idh/MocA family oxidoreductase [Mycolicibacterium holsaticum]MDA4106226.1 oxidoreductase [Mycolicibacterium holsaticum DSM 44478 = JCM 12374]ODQ95457.1 oxidoreductase [Mycolicibacterium holsaticum]QZA13456.1 Gfo/Idh/MocA family oxidoreductase [Mycolicibacterium holsaticum DSM 44478 = JCM 12374]UNC09079.1 Gfo/Idh/MocA family oxidoreductase [Mycolicibacterium holsaticum DSM 44478 = JCM 12374]
MKVVVIGTGFGKHAAAPAYQSVGFDVEVVSPRDASAVKTALASDVDLVSVHSPPFLHLEHVGGAIEHGHAVLCDKPFGRNADEAITMRDKAQQAGVANFLNFEFRFNASWSMLKKLSDTGAIGTPTHLSWTFFGSGLRGRTLGWINDRELGGGWIGAYGSHLIDFTRWLFDSDIVDCGGVTRTDIPGATAEDGYSAWFRLANGATATHDTGFAAAVASTPRVTLMGSAGTIELTADTTLVLRRPDQEPDVTEFDPPPRRTPPPALTTYFAEVADALRTGASIAPSFDDGVAAARTMDLLKAGTA